MYTQTLGNRGILVALGAMFTLACGESNPPSGPETPPVGVIEIKLTTTGLPEDLDPDGYSVYVDNRVYGGVAINKSMTIDFAAGNHSVLLADLAPNCSINGSHELTVEVLAGQSVSAAFDVACVVNIGALRVFTRTTGLDATSYHYTANLEGIGNLPLGATDMVSFSTVRAGTRQITLTDISTNCVADGPNPRAVQVPFNDTAVVIFAVECPYEDGELIAYSDGNGAIYTVHPDGTGSKDLSTNGIYNASAPAWSPGGARIAFDGVSDGGSGIFVMDADGGNQLRLTTPGGNFSQPAWSPDGSRIAFNRDNAIWLMNADGTNAVQLVVSGSDPDWSPDGKRIAFSGGGNLNGIWTIGADGSNDARLTADNDSEPAWSPDGTRIAFHRYYYGGWYYEDTHDIYVVNTDGGGLTQLTMAWSGGSVGTPTWKGNGGTIAFSGEVCSETCESKLWLVNTQNLGFTQIPTASSAYSPAWRR